MPDDKDKIAKLEEENAELEHEIIEQKLQGLKGQLLALGDTLHQRIDDTDTQNEKEFSHIKEGIDQVLVVVRDTYIQTKRTSGRVSTIESDRKVEALQKQIADKEHAEVKKDTRVVRFLHRYPIVTTGFLLVGFLFSLPEIREFTFSGITRFFMLFSKIF